MRRYSSKNKIVKCYNCDESYQLDSLNSIVIFPNTNEQVFVCDQCFNEYYQQCKHYYWEHVNNAQLIDLRKKDTYKTVNNECYCNKCFNKYIVKCNICNKHIDIEDINITKLQDKYYCKDCFEDNFEQCCECGHYENKKDLFKVHDESGKKCYVCKYCKRYYPNN